MRRWQSDCQLPHANDAQTRVGMAVMRVMVVRWRAQHARNVARVTRSVNSIVSYEPAGRGRDVPHPGARRPYFDVIHR